MLVNPVFGMQKALDILILLIPTSTRIYRTPKNIQALSNELMDIFDVKIFKEDLYEANSPPVLVKKACLI